MQENKNEKIIKEMRKQVEALSNGKTEKTLDLMHYEFLDKRENTFSKVEEFESIINSSKGHGSIIVLLKDIIKSLQEQNDIQKLQIDELTKKSKINLIFLGYVITLQKSVKTNLLF